MKMSVFAAALAAFATLAPLAPASSAGEGRVAVMSAFAPEWRALLGATANRETRDINGQAFVTGTLAGREVVLLLSGVSMVNAAMTTQLVIDRFKPTAILFSGIAGGIDPALSIGDVVVADRWAGYMEAVYAREVDGRFAPPPFIATPFPNFGMIFPTETEIARGPDREPERRFWFPVDAGLLEIAAKVAGGIDLRQCADGGACLGARPRVVVGGNGVSGTAFVDNARFRAYVHGTFQAKVVDMESAATAQVAHVNGVPFLAIRSLSDLAGGGGHENEMTTFLTLASENSAKVVTAILRALP